MLRVAVVLLAFVAALAAGIVALAGPSILSWGTRAQGLECSGARTLD